MQQDLPHAMSADAKRKVKRLTQRAAVEKNKTKQKNTWACAVKATTVKKKSLDRVFFFLL